MRKHYFTALAACTVLTLLLASPGLLVGVLIFTFGLATPFVLPLPTLTAALWVAFPALFFWEKSGRRWVGLVLSALAFAALFPGPVLFAYRSAAEDLARQGDMPPATVVLPQGIGIEIHRAAAPEADFFVVDRSTRPSYGQDNCFDICQDRVPKNGGMRRSTAGDPASTSANVCCAAAPSAGYALS